MCTYAFFVGWRVLKFFVCYVSFFLAFWSPFGLLPFFQFLIFNLIFISLPSGICFVSLGCFTSAYFRPFGFSRLVGLMRCCLRWWFWFAFLCGCASGVFWAACSGPVVCFCAALWVFAAVFFLSLHRPSACMHLRRTLSHMIHLLCSRFEAPLLVIAPCFRCLLLLCVLFGSRCCLVGLLVSSR